MHISFNVHENTSGMREELISIGVKELHTPMDVELVMEEKKQGTMLLVINSVCGCAAGNARPALRLALEQTKKHPQKMYSVFAGIDKEATEKARSYFREFPPSSPSFIFFQNGSVKAVIPRHRIQGRKMEEISQDLVMIFNAF